MKRILLKLACSLCFLIHAQAQNGAPSTWLWYQDNGAGNILTNDVYVPSAGSTLYTYYCTLQFNSGQDGGGYCGIQNHPNGYNFIFSIWDPSNHQVITTHYLGNGTLAQNFGGEGTGLKTWNFSLGWATDSWITNALRRWDYNGHTYYGYWINKRSGIGAGWYLSPDHNGFPHAIYLF